MIGYKIFKIVNGEFYSPFMEEGSGGYTKYSHNWTKPNDGCGPFVLFRREEDAKQCCMESHYARPLTDNAPLCVGKCEYNRVPSQTIYGMNVYCLEDYGRRDGPTYELIRNMNLPWDIDFAQELKILEQIELSPKVIYIRW